MANKTYGEWFSEQTLERQKASAEIMKVCQRLGEAKRTNPYGEEAEQLSAQVRAYNERYPND